MAEALTYDADNRLTSAPGAQGTEQYAYAADNKRVYSELPNGDERYYLWAGNQLVARTDVRQHARLLASQEVLATHIILDSGRRAAERENKGAPRSKATSSVRLM